MKITDIKQQVKRQNRYSVFLDGKYRFSLGESQLLKLGLHKNQQLTEVELKDLLEESEFGKVYEKTLNLLSYRLRSEWELRDYLKRKKYSPALIDNILNKLSDNNLVNDKQFAQRWVENRRLLKPTSTRKLRQELAQKRIDKQVVDEVLANDETDELEELQKIIEKKQSRYPDKQKFIAYLARQGFNYGDIKTALADQY